MRMRGFTLIELLVVIAIIGILVLLLLPFLGITHRRSQVTATKATIHNLKTALDQYRLSWDSYPIKPGGTGKNKGGGNVGFYQTPSVAKDSKSAGDEDNAALVALLFATRDLDLNKNKVATANGRLQDEWKTPLVARFLILPPNAANAAKLTDKCFIWSYGLDQTNNVDATAGAFVNGAPPNYDNAEAGTIEASGVIGDDVTSWR